MTSSFAFDDSGDGLGVVGLAYLDGRLDHLDPMTSAPFQVSTFGGILLKRTNLRTLRGLTPPPRAETDSPLPKYSKSRNSRYVRRSTRHPPNVEFGFRRIRLWTHLFNRRL